MRIKTEDEYDYLIDKSLPYIAGWVSCTQGETALTSKKQFKTQQERAEFDQGYGDCYANGESEPTEFNYEEGI